MGFIRIYTEFTDVSVDYTRPPCGVEDLRWEKKKRGRRATGTVELELEVETGRGKRRKYADARVPSLKFAAEAHTNVVAPRELERPRSRGVHRGTTLRTTI
jgi:hypothetical protein